MDRAVELFAVVNLVVVGLSHALQPRVWAVCFIQLRERGQSSVFAIALLHLVFGSLIVAFHNVWSGIPVLLTLYGWANVGKALVYATMPRMGLAALQHIDEQRPGKFVIAGLAMLLLAAGLIFHLATSGAK